MEKLVIKIYALLKVVYRIFLRLQIKRTGSCFSPDFFLKIKDGKNIFIGNNFSTNGVIRLYADSGILTIGDNNSYNSNVYIGASGGEIIIGNNVLIGPNSVLRASDHKFDRGQIIKYQGHSSGTIIIEDDVWLGANVVVLRNVIIRKGSVIGAGSVVTRDTEEYSINVGIPAKKISERK